MKTPITAKERALLRAIADSEYQDGDPTNNPIWLDYVVNSKSQGGVLTSLQRKGLVSLHLVSREDSDNYRHSRITDSTIALTAEGVTALNG